MQVRITGSIASADWSFAAGQLVEVGESFGPAEIPADVLPSWIESGIAEATDETETASLKKKVKK
jgi:hypothetical protein